MSTADEPRREHNRNPIVLLTSTWRARPDQLVVPAGERDDATECPQEQRGDKPCPATAADPEGLGQLRHREPEQDLAHVHTDGREQSHQLPGVVPIKVHRLLVIALEQSTQGVHSEQDCGGYGEAAGGQLQLALAELDHERRHQHQADERGHSRQTEEGERGVEAVEDAAGVGVRHTDSNV